MTLGEQARLRAAAVMLPPLLWTMVFLFVPYIITFAYSFYTKQFPTFVPDFQLGNYLQLVQDPQYYRVLFRSLKIAGSTALLALVLAYPLAYFLVFKVRSSSLRALLYMATIVPLWVSYLLRAYTWKTILGSEGVLNSFLIWTGISSEPSEWFLYSQFSMVITLTYIFIPFMVMPIFSSLEKIPPNLVEASKDLGVGPIRSFVRIVLPLSMPGVIAGITFTFCLSFGDFVAPFLVGGPDGAMVATVIQSQFGSALNWPLGSALSTVMLAIVLIIISLSDRMERSGRLDLA